MPACLSLSLSPLPLFLIILLPSPIPSLFLSPLSSSSLSCSPFSHPLPLPLPSPPLPHYPALPSPIPSRLSSYCLISWWQVGSVDWTISTACTIPQQPCRVVSLSTAKPSTASINCFEASVLGILQFSVSYSRETLQMPALSVNLLRDHAGLILIVL
jgi:hypothetical protein